HEGYGREQDSERQPRVWVEIDTERHHIDAAAAARVGLVLVQSRKGGVHLVLGLSQTNACPEASDGLPPGVKIPVVIRIDCSKRGVVPGGIGLERGPELGVLERQLETRRHHPDYFPVESANPQGLSDNVTRGSESADP